MLHTDKIRQFQTKIFERRDDHQRNFPWRENIDPYWVFVSEVMSQQTQLDRVVPKFEKFVTRLPSIQDLAGVDKKTLLQLWSGLGFNSRALRLKSAAESIVSEYSGNIPSSRDLLLSLPGIGPYTSASICAFAYNLPEPVIDTNIRRVLIHELGIDLHASVKDMEDIARSCIPVGKSRDWHGALMDYGSLVATPKATGIKPISKQSKFAGSDREVRGWILKKLVSQKENNELHMDTISENFPKKEVKSIVRGMLRDGLVSKKNKLLFIADGH